MVQELKPDEEREDFQASGTDSNVGNGTKNVLLLLATIIGGASLLLDLLGLFSGAFLGSSAFGNLLGNIFAIGGMDSNSAALVHSSLALAGTATTFAAFLLLPSLLLRLVAVILGAVGCARNSSGFALATAIIYAAGLFLGLDVFVLVSMVLAFVAYAQMRPISGR